jgi:hypothetical protein
MKYSKFIIMGLIVLIAIMAGTVAANATTYTDDFTNSNSWTISGGGIGVTGNTLHFPAASGGQTAIYKTAITSNNWVVEYDIKQVVSGAASITYFVNNGNYRAVAFDQSQDKLWLWCGNSGDYASPSVTLSPGTYYHMKIKGNATGIYAYIDGNYVGMKAGNAGFSGCYPCFNNGGSEFSIKNFYLNDAGQDQVFTSDTTYKGYVTDANGNALEYCNVTLWDSTTAGTPLKSDLTDANGYYELAPQTVNIGSHYNMSVRPPNSGYSNIYAFTANATTPMWLNFTSAPVKLQVYVYDANYGITHDLTGFNISVNKNTGASVVNWHNKSSPWNDPNDYMVGDYVTVNVTKEGYINGTYTINSMAAGWNVIQVPLYRDFAGGSYVYILGYMIDGNAGARVDGLKAWLLDEADNVIDTSTGAIGANAGYYALRVPTTTDITYHVVIYCPGYGNTTAHLHNGGATTSFGNAGASFTYPAAFAGTIDGNAQVDLIIDGLTWVPSTYPTPTPTGTPVVPTGYNTIHGTTYVITTGQGIPNVPIWVYGQDGVTLIGSATTDASGNYVISFNTAGLASQILKLVPGETAKYNNDSATTYISWPFAASASSYRCDIGLAANADYAQWIMQGYFYNALKGEQYHISGGTLNLWTGDGNTLISTVGTNGNGYYIMYLERDITPGTYLVEAKATGYTHQNMTMTIPGSFGSDEYYNLSVAMVPASIGTDNNNALGIQITDNSTGNILNNAHYTIKYANNGTVYTTGSMGGQYVVYLYNLPVATYEIEGSFTGYDTNSYIIEIQANNWYKITIGLFPILVPTAYPTGTPSTTITPVTNPNGGLQWDGILSYALHSFGIYDPVLVRLLKGVLIIFGCAVGAGFCGAILERGHAGSVTLIFALLGAALGFIIACLVPNIWPWWLLVVVCIVGAFGFFVWKYITGGMSTGGSGGAGGQ